MLRREFINKSLIGAGLAVLPGRLFSAIDKDNLNMSASVDAIELFRYDINIPRHFSWGTWYNRQHVFMKISSGNYSGWSEIPVSKNNPEFDLVKWSGKHTEYKGKSIADALQLLSSFQVNDSLYSEKMMEFIELGLLDLLGRVNNRPGIDLLSLNGKNPVPGLFCILQNDLEKVKEQARASVEQNLSSHMKVKMFGNEHLDMSILQTVQEVIGKDAMIMADANRGYKEWNALDDLKKILIDFHNKGLSAMEDPALMQVNEWIELQQMVGDFSLIPDHIMGPSWEGMEKIKAGMGHIYNIHPSRMGSIEHGIRLAHKIKSFGGKLMIGDDSLVGPACTIWQQIAIGAGAAWVEAIEKYEDSDAFLNCVVDKATYRDSTGKYSMKVKPGFGLEMDEERLKSVCKAYVNV